MRSFSKISVSLIAASALVLSACSSGSSDSGDSSAASKRACIILPDADSGTRWEPGDRPALEGALTAAGFEVDIQPALIAGVNG